MRHVRGSFGFTPEGGGRLSGSASLRGRTESWGRGVRFGGGGDVGVGLGVGRVVGRMGVGLPLETLALTNNLLLAIDSFTRAGTVGKRIGSTSNRPIVNTAVAIGNGTMNVASVSNGFSISTTPNAGLAFACLKVAPRAIGTSGRVDVALRSSSGTLGRIIIVNCNITGGSSLANSIATVGPSSGGGNIIIGTRSVLANGITNMGVADGSNAPNNNTGVHIHNNSSLGTSGSPLVIVSNLTVSGSNMGNLSGLLSMMGPRSVRSFDILGSTSTATVCNSHNSGNIVVVAAGGNHGNRGPAISCSNDMAVDRGGGAISILDTSRFHTGIRELCNGSDRTCDTLNATGAG